MQSSILTKITKKRLERNFSQHYMASQLNISQSYYNKIENGKKELTINRILDIVKVLNIPVTDLLNSDENKSA